MDVTTGKRYCFFTDYLGNVRSVIDDSGYVLEHDGYYPYGAASNAAAASVQPLKFGGKELERRGGHKSFIMMEIRWIVFRLLILKYQSALVVIHRMRLKKLLMSIHKER